MIEFFDENECLRAAGATDQSIGPVIRDVIKEPFFLQALESGFVEGADLPEFIFSTAEILGLSDDELRSRVTQWMDGTPFDEPTRQHKIEQEYRVHREARVFKERLLQDERTTDALDRGLTIIPHDVVQDFVDEVYDAQAGQPISPEYIRTVGIGLTGAFEELARRYSTTIPPIELIERSILHALPIALAAEASRFPSIHYEAKAGEYVHDDISNTLTSALHGLLSVLDHERFKPSDSGLSESSSSIRSLDRVIADLIVSYAPHEAYTEEIGLEQEPDVLPFRIMLTAISNARWRIRALASPETFVDPVMQLEDEITRLRQAGASIATDVAVLMTFLENPASFRGSSTPVGTLREELVRARRDHDVSSTLTVLQSIVDSHTSAES